MKLTIKFFHLLLLIIILSMSLFTENTNAADQDVLKPFHESWDRGEVVSTLKDMIQIETISTDSTKKPENFLKCANYISDFLNKLEIKADFKTSGNSNPYIYAERIDPKNKLTVMFYAHYDTVSVEKEGWVQSQPFSPEIKTITFETADGIKEDLRLFGRGSADDKGPLVSSLYAIHSIITLDLPVNIQILFDPEEESGNDALSAVLKQIPKIPDILFVMDGGNYDVGIPEVVTACRGYIGLEITCRSLKASVHSGVWGGMIPDPAIALSQVLGKMTASDGSLALPFITIPPISAEEKKKMEAIPSSDEIIRQKAGLLPGVQIFRFEENPFIQQWRYPSFTINCFQASNKESISNIINDSAFAKISFRIPPGMDTDAFAENVKNFITKNMPWGLKVEIKGEPNSYPWELKTKYYPLLDKMNAALTEAYGKPTINMGDGASITILDAVNQIGDFPAFEVGCDDPQSHSHGPDESVSLNAVKKLTEAVILFTNSLAIAPQTGFNSSLWK